MTANFSREGTKRIYLVRHPETDWNRQQRYQGRTGRPFSPHGEASMQAMVDYLCRVAPDTIVSSPTLHAAAVAGKLALSIGLEPAMVDDGWCEVDHGKWEGLRHEEVMQRFGADTAQRFNDPFQYIGHGGETLEEVNRRVNLSWQGLIATAGDVVALISHATPISLVLCRCAEIPPSKYRLFRLDNNCVTGIDITGASIVIDSVNHRIEP